ncbi:MAG: hypothetical protein AB1746_00085 [Candidatus Zixiibacteriota bacterium]
MESRYGLFGLSAVHFFPDSPEVVEEKQFDGSLQGGGELQRVHKRWQFPAGFPKIQVAGHFEVEKFRDVPLPKIPFFTVSSDLIPPDCFEVAGHEFAIFVFVLLRKPKTGRSDDQ